MTEITAPITDVTVYADRALVTRKGHITLEAGEHELRINDLPLFLRDSLRASGRGPQGIRILNVDITTAFHSRPPETELVALQNTIEQLQQQAQLLQARQESASRRNLSTRLSREPTRVQSPSRILGDLLMPGRACGPRLNR